MRSFIMMVLWVSGAEAFLLLAGALGGLAALKGAALIGYSAALHKAHKYEYIYNHYRYGRTIQSAPDAEQNLLLSAVGKLDTEGCILKMLCHLQTKEKASRSQEEVVLVDLFTNITETHYNAAFIRAAGIGTKARDTHQCDKHFSKCPLSQAQLGDLLQQAWGCDLYFVANDRLRQQQLIVANHNI